MALGPQGYVSIAEIIVYIPSLVLAAIVCSRHGLGRASGWIYTLILCLIRVIGAICQLVTYSNNSTGLLQATVIFDSVGLSPLLFATLGLVSRLGDWISAKGSQAFSIKHIRLVQLLITLGLILAIVGGTSVSPSPDGTITTPATSKAGIIIYIVAFAALSYFFLKCCLNKSAVPVQERRILLAVAVAWPLILVRLLYSALAIFVHSSTFSIMGGSVTARVVMATVEEFLVVIDYLTLGFILQKLTAEEQGELVTRQWKQPRNRGRDTSRQENSRREPVRV